MKQVFKQIWNERKSNAWLWAELLIVFVALWYIVDWTYANARIYYEPRGFDITDTYMVTIEKKTPKAEDYIIPEEKTTGDGEDLLEVVERLRRLPEVEEVSISINARPYTGNNSTFAFRVDSINEYVLRRPVTTGFFQVFRYQSADGGGSQPLAAALERGEVVASENLLGDRHTDRRAMNRELANPYDSTQTFRVGAVSRKVRYADFWSNYEDRYVALLLPDAEVIRNNDISWFEICLRVNAGTPLGFAERIMEISDAQLSVGNLFILSVESFSDIRRNFQQGNVNAIKTRIWMMAFLLMNIFLGIIGTFWFRTQHRRAEVGLRMALGSSRANLRSLLINEGLALLGLASIPAMVIAINLGYADLIEGKAFPWTISRFLICSGITLTLMAGMIVAGIWYPARQAMKIQPAEALHEE